MDPQLVGLFFISTPIKRNFSRQKWPVRFGNIQGSLTTGIPHEGICFRHQQNLLARGSKCTESSREGGPKGRGVTEGTLGKLEELWGILGSP